MGPGPGSGIYIPVDVTDQPDRLKGNAFCWTVGLSIGSSRYQEDHTRKV